MVENKNSLLNTVPSIVGSINILTYLTVIVFLTEPLA